MPVARKRSVKVAGKVLYLTEATDKLRAQLEGPGTRPPQTEGKSVDVDVETEALVNNISTDELTPGWVCYYYDETLARYCLVGLRGGVIGKDAIKNGGFGVIVSAI